MPQVATVKILDAATATGAGLSHEIWGNRRTFQLIGSTGSGAGAASVAVEVSQDNVTFKTLGTLSLVLGTSAVSDGFTSLDSWRYTRGNVLSISGTGATVTLLLGSLPH